MVDDVYGKEATTYYRVIGVEKQRTRVALYPQTGRTHQLRVHCSHREGLALPIVGIAFTEKVTLVCIFMLLLLR